MEIGHQQADPLASGKARERSIYYPHMNKYLLGLVVLIIIGGVVYYLTRGTAPVADTPSDYVVPEVDQPTTPTPEDVPITEEQVPVAEEPMTVIGESVDGRDIVAYHYGTGDTELLFVGGIHGGYSWNTTLVAYELMDYLEESSGAIPEGVRVTVIPVLNPDGLYSVIGKEGRFSASDVSGNTVAGRFNANTVDLNRNFDCGWQEKGVWQSREVSGGSAPFSEPESKAMQTYVEEHMPDAVVVYYSAVGGVFSSNCYNGVLPETKTLTSLYANASGYRAYEDFNFYDITGDMVNWLAKERIPAISVLLTNHTDTEWSKNRAGVDALLNYYGG